MANFANQTPTQQTDIPSIAINAFKGGVSKTTVSFNLAWALAEQNVILLVDMDPQCNLTQVFSNSLPEEQVRKLSRFIDYTNPDILNIGESLYPLITGVTMEPPLASAVQHPMRPNLYLLPGSFDLAEYEKNVAAAEISAVLATAHLINAPRYVMQGVAKQVGAVLIIIDTPPSTSSLNMITIMTSNYFLVPLQADYFSLKAIQSVQRAIIGGNNQIRSWIRRIDDLVTLTAVLPPNRRVPDRLPKYLGSTISMFTIRSGEPAGIFQAAANRIEAETRIFYDSLRVIAPQRTMAVRLEEGNENLIIGEIKNFNRFGPMAQTVGLPILGLLLPENRVHIVRVTFNDDGDFIERVPLTGVQLNTAINALQNIGTRFQALVTNVEQRLRLDGVELIPMR